jgi:ABC-2 type transport system ATP-binding protein
MGTGPLDVKRETAPDNGDAAAVVVDGLRKTYGELVAVDDASFTVSEGEIFGILGPNGAGKTTTVECVIGLRIPDAGIVRVLGLDPRKDLDALHAVVGVQLQASALPAQLKVGEILELFQSFYRDHADLDEIIGALRLGDHLKKYYRSLSGGLKQRVSIALALIGRPKIAVLDEMTTGLDPQARRDTWELIEAVRDRGVTILLVTHYMDEAERLCNRVALFDQGRVVAIDTPEALAGRAGVEKRVRFVPSRPFDDALLTRLPEVSSLEHDGDHVVVTGSGELANVVILTLADNGVTANDMHLDTANLEDAFVALTGRHIHEVVPGKVHR